MGAASDSRRGHPKRRWEAGYAVGWTHCQATAGTFHDASHCPPKFYALTKRHSGLTPTPGKSSCPGRAARSRRPNAPVKAEAFRELEEVTEFLRQGPWLSHHGAERCARAVVAPLAACTSAWLGRWTPKASRTQCCRRLPGACASTCWFRQPEG